MALFFWCLLASNLLGCLVRWEGKGTRCGSSDSGWFRNPGTIKYQFSDWVKGDCLVSLLCSAKLSTRSINGFQSPTCWVDLNKVSRCGDEGDESDARLCCYLVLCSAVQYSLLLVCPCKPGLGCRSKAVNGTRYRCVLSKTGNPLLILWIDYDNSLSIRNDTISSFDNWFGL